MKTIYSLQFLFIWLVFGLFTVYSQTPKQTDTIIQLYLLNQLADSFDVKDSKHVTPLCKYDSLFAYAQSFMGKKYKRGGTNFKGFDCSGYTMTVFKHFGIKLPHTSAGQSLIGIEVNKKNIKKGDLIFFKGRSSRRNRIGHVGIVISEPNEPIRFIHSSSGDGVRIDRLDADYYKRRYIKTTRIFLN